MRAWIPVLLCLVVVAAFAAVGFVQVITAPTTPVVPMPTVLATAR
jgi:hypothetical protein